MARRVAQSDPALSIDFFNSGYFSYRNPLFAPFKSYGVNLVQLHDSVVDGKNFEDTDLLEWQRRPGFARFCPTQLGGSEVVNQFYSSRDLNGQINAFFDSTARLASFTDTGITTILNKETQNQGYPTTVGNMTYFSDGTAADMQKWGSPSGSNAAPALSSWGLAAPTVTPTISNLGCWLPDTLYSIGNAIYDPNGSVEVCSTLLESNVTSTVAPSTGNIAFAGNVGSNFSVSGDLFTQAIAPGTTGHTVYAAFTGFGFALPSDAIILGVVVNLQKQGSNAQIYDQSVKLVQSGGVVGTDHVNFSNTWPPSGFLQTAYGSPTDTWGLSLTPADVNDSGFGVAIAASMLFPSMSSDIVISIGASSPVTPTITVYYVLGSSSSGTSGTNQPIWATTLGATTSDGRIQWTNYGPILSWSPDQYFPLPCVVIDTNGNLQLATVAENPIASWDAGATYNVGDIVTFGGTYWTAAAGSTGIPPNQNYTTSTATTTGGTTTGTVTSYWTPASGPLQTGVNAPIWNTTPGGTTSPDGNYTWLNIGQGSFVETVGTSYCYGFRTIYGHLSTCSPVSISTGSILGPATATITAFAISSGLVTFQGINNFVPGNIFIATGLTTGTYLNDVPLTVQAAGLTSSQFTASFSHADVGQTFDSGSTLNLISKVQGVGTGSALCNSTATITATAVSANIVTITAVNNFVPGLYVTLAGLTSATFLNNQQLQVINVDPDGAWFQVDFVTPNQAQISDGGTATFNAVEIYRVSDGGGIYLFAGAVTNPGANTSWTYNDFTTDDDLDILQIAPQNDLNDPPPGAPGSTIPTPGTITTYWQGRLWMVVGNYVYFDAGPDCINGIPEESWPPANRFQYAGPVLALKPTPDGIGLLVFIADRVDVILGGPETIAFYTTDFLENFGISNPNAIFKDGSTLGQFTTQGQFFSLTSQGKSNDGERIADYLANNFNPLKTYVTMHRDGNDVGVFISNGVDQVIRLGTNIDAWSVPAFPVGGAGAMRSIETSVGVYTLMLGSPTGGGYLLGRDLTVWQDNGENYEDAYVTIGSITLSQSGGALFPLQHVVGYFDAVGTLGVDEGPSVPQLSILPNEIRGDVGIGFIDLPEVIPEPPQGQNQPSSTLQALRWNTNMMNSNLASQFIHHLQVKIRFAPENAPNTIKALAFGENQTT